MCLRSTHHNLNYISTVCLLLLFTCSPTTPYTQTNTIIDYKRNPYKKLTAATLLLLPTSANWDSTHATTNTKNPLPNATHIDKHSAHLIFNGRWQRNAVVVDGGNWAYNLSSDLRALYARVPASSRACFVIDCCGVMALKCTKTKLYARQSIQFYMHEPDTQTHARTSRTYWF